MLAGELAPGAPFPSVRELSQELKINPRLYQAMDMLYMPLLDLQQHLKQEFLTNPFLELEDASVSIAGRRLDVGLAKATLRQVRLKSSDIGVVVAELLLVAGGWAAAIGLGKLGS